MSATSPHLVLVGGGAETPLDSAVVESVEHAAASRLGTSEVRVARLTLRPSRDAAGGGMADGDARRAAGLMIGALETSVASPAPLPPAPPDASSPHGAEHGGTPTGRRVALIEPTGLAWLLAPGSDRLPVLRLAGDADCRATAAVLREPGELPARDGAAEQARDTDPSEIVAGIRRVAGGRATRPASTTRSATGTPRDRARRPVAGLALGAARRGGAPMILVARVASRVDRPDVRRARATAAPSSPAEAALAPDVTLVIAPPERSATWTR